MKYDSEVEYILGQLSHLGHVTSRAMFGGHGLYLDRLIFAIIVDGSLYLKADAEAKVFYQSAGSEPFTYMGKNKPVSMSYWLVPEEVLEDQESLRIWTQFAINAANQAKKTKTPRKKRGV